MIKIMRTIFNAKSFWIFRKRSMDEKDCSLSIGAMPVSSLTTDTDIAFHSPASVGFSGEGDV